MVQINKQKKWTHTHTHTHDIFTNITVYNKTCITWWPDWLANFSDQRVTRELQI